MQPRETEYPFVPSADERARSQQVIKYWETRAEEWNSRLSRFDREWAVEAIDARERESESSLQGERLGFPPGASPCMIPPVRLSRG